MQDKIIVFQNKKIRRIWHEEEWHFSVVDVVSVLTESKDDLTARKYWNKLAQRLRAEGSESVTNCHQLKLEANDGKKYATDCANTQTLFRIIQSEKDFAILTSEISKATFGITPSEYKELKGLKKKSQNFRDHMTDLELIFTMLGEKVTTEISKTEKPNTFGKNKKVAKRGGKVAGVARKQTEKELGRSVISKKNYLPKRKDIHHG